MALLTPMNENVCEMPPARCGFTKRPSEADLRKIQEATGLPKHIIDRAFSGRGGSRSKRGGLSEGVKDKVCSAILVLVAGGTVFYAVPLAEAFLVQIGLLPVLCDQNILEHIGINLVALGTGGATESCAQRANRYNVITATLITALSATGLFTRASIKMHYDLAHAYVKAWLFQDETALAAAEAALRAAQAPVPGASYGHQARRSPVVQPSSPAYDPNVPPQLSPVVSQEDEQQAFATGTAPRGRRSRSRARSDSSGSEQPRRTSRRGRSRGKGVSRSPKRRTRKHHRKPAKKHGKKHGKKHTKKHAKKHGKKHGKTHRRRR